jgi:hypothetical protein
MWGGSGELGSGYGGAVATFGLALVEEGVDFFEGGLRGGGDVAYGSSDRDGEVDGGRSNRDGGGGDEPSAPFGNGLEARGIDILGEHEELFAAPAAYAVVGSKAVGEGIGDSFEDDVADRVAIGIIDVLEVVNIEEEHSYFSLKFAGFLYRLVDEHLDMAAVGDACEVIDVGQSFKLSGAAFDGFLCGDVGKDFNGANDLSYAITDWGNAYVDWYAVAALVPEIDFSSVPASILECGGEWAATVAQLAAVVVDVTQDVVKALPAYDLLAEIAG